LLNEVQNFAEFFKVKTTF